jgi:hypothetical protein
MIKKVQDPSKIYIWAQMFFCDGSVSQGIRIPDVALYSREMQDETAELLLKDTNRKEGLLLLWGCGMTKGITYPLSRSISFSLSEELET